MTYEDYCDMVADSIKDQEEMSDEDCADLYEWQQLERDERCE